MDLIGLPKDVEVIPVFHNPFSRESFKDMSFDIHYEDRGNSYQLCKEHLEFMKEWIKANIQTQGNQPKIQEDLSP